MRKSLLALGMLALPCAPLRADTFCVNGAAQLNSTLATAKTNGVDDTIRLVQGTYVGSFLHDANNGLTVEGGWTGGCASRAVNPANTVLDGNAAAQTLRLYSTTAVAYRVDGVTIRNGRALSTIDPSTMNGGGLWAITYGGSITLTNSIVQGNAAYQDGGGVYAYRAQTVLVQNSTIDNNDAGFGAGFYAVDCRSVTLDSNTIINNAASFPSPLGDGGGVFVDTTFPTTGSTGSSTVTLRNNVIGTNSAGQTGGGAFIFGDGDGSTTAVIRLTGNTFHNNSAPNGGGLAMSFVDSLDATGNTLRNNTASSNGGGLALFATRLATLTDNVIHGNTALDGGGVYSIEAPPASPVRQDVITLTNNTLNSNTATTGYGGGILIQLRDDNDVANVYNNVIYGNTAPGTSAAADVGVIRDGNANSVPSPLNLRNNDFNQSVAGTFITPSGYVIDPSNLNNQNPSFVNPGAGDYRINSGSPCRDTGDLGAPALPALDRGGLFRIAGSKVDIGAHEFGALPFHKRRIVDFDGDGRSDIAVYQPASGLWFVRESGSGATTSIGFGGPGYTTVPGDYDNDGRTDFAAYHESSGLWFIRPSSTGVAFSVGYGGPGYSPVPADYDGDGETDPAVYHAATGLWFVLQSTTDTTFSLGYGGADYTPVPEDYDGDGKADLAVFHPSTGLWFLRASSTGTTTTVGYGGTGYSPVPRDYDGDGRADVAVYHPPTGLWFVRQSTTLTTSTVGFGGNGYAPVPGYRDGDGRGDLTVYHPPTGLWYVRESQTGAVSSLGFGGPGYDPVE